MTDAEDRRKRRLNEAYGRGVEKARQTGALEHFGDATANIILPDSMGVEEFQSYKAGYNAYVSGTIPRDPPHLPPVVPPVALDPSEKAWYALCNSSDFIPESVVEFYQKQLLAQGHQDTFVVGLRNFASHACPKCGAQGAFKIHFLGRLDHPECSWSGYMGPGSYAGFQLAHVFQSGIRAGGSAKADSDRKGDRSGGWMYGILVFLVVGIARAMLAVILIPLHAVVGLFQSHRSRADVIARTAIVGAFVVAVGVTAFWLSRQTLSNSPVLDQVAHSSVALPATSQVALLHQPCSPGSVPTPLELSTAPNWSLTTWQTNGNASWKQQPVIVINGVDYPINTPQHGIYYLTQIKNAGGTGDVDGSLGRFQTARSEFYDCPDYPVDQTRVAASIPEPQGSVTPINEPLKTAESSPTDRSTPAVLTSNSSTSKAEPNVEPTQNSRVWKTYANQSLSITYPGEWEVSARERFVIIAPAGGVSGDDVIRGVLIRSFYVKGNHPGWGALDEATRTLMAQSLMLPGNQWNGKIESLPLSGFEGRSSILTGPSLAGGTGTAWVLTTQTATFSPLWVVMFGAPDVEYARYQETFRTMRDSLHLTLDHF